MECIEEGGDRVRISRDQFIEERVKLVALYINITQHYLYLKYLKNNTISAKEHFESVIDVFGCDRVEVCEGSLNDGIIARAARPADAGGAGDPAAL